MKSPEELKQIFLQERIDYWQKINPHKAFTAHDILNELEMIQRGFRRR